MDGTVDEPKGRSGAIKGLVLRTTRVLIAVYLVIFVFALCCSDRLVFPQPPASYQDDETIQKLELRDGTRISFRIFEAKNPRCHMLYSHGNYEDIGDHEYHLTMISTKLGCTVYAYDYPGYGTSEGKPNEGIVTESALAVFDRMVADGTPAQEIIIYGRSVGSGPSCALARQRKARALILQSPFISALRVATRVPIVPFDTFDNLDKIKDIELPLMVMHGRQDRVVPFWHGETLFAAAKNPVRSYWIDEAGHDDFMSTAGADYWRELSEFIQSL